MKITGNIIEASTTGDGIKIVAQARIGRAGWLPIERHTFIVSDTAQNRQAFHVGREISITIKPVKP